MATIKYLLKGKKETAGIYVRIIDGTGIDIMAKTSFIIKKSDWNAEKQQPKNLKNHDNKELISDLVEFKANLLKHYNKSKGKVDICTQWLKDFISPPAKLHELPTTLIGYFEEYINLKKKTVSPNTIKKFNVVKNKVIKLQEELTDYRKKSNGSSIAPYDAFLGKYSLPLQIKHVNRDFQNLFESFCGRHRYADNTVTMEMRFIKTICRHARDNGLETHPHLEKIENKYSDVDSIYLTEADLAKVKKVKLSESLDNIRDWLLISCYCGQRVSDFLRFNKSMIREQKNREGKIVSLIEFEQTKTGKMMTLPLHSEIVRILGKREGEFPASISDQKYNQYVKAVCQKAGLTYKVTGSKKTETEKDSGIFRKETGEFEKWELVSSHIGRRSFATNFYGKIPTSLLIAATGHSTEQMFLNYIGKSQSDRAIELAEYF